jgi:hypothetical protein
MGKNKNSENTAFPPFSTFPFSFPYTYFIPLKRYVLGYISSEKNTL